MIADTNQLTCQKAAFSLPTDSHYLNCATRGPFSRAVEQAGVAAIRLQTNPFSLTAAHFFEQPMRVRQLFSEFFFRIGSDMCFLDVSRRDLSIGAPRAIKTLFDQKIIVREKKFSLGKVF